MKRRVILKGNEQRSGRERKQLRTPNDPAVRVSHRPDIGCRLAGPRTKRGMGVRPGMLMVLSGRCRMRKGTTRRNERQGQIDHGDPESHNSG